MDQDDRDSKERDRRSPDSPERRETMRGSHPNNLSYRDNIDNR
jgi:hypothetical protein